MYFNYKNIDITDYADYVLPSKEDVLNIFNKVKANKELESLRFSNHYMHLLEQNDLTSPLLFCVGRAKEDGHYVVGDLLQLWNLFIGGKNQAEKETFLHSIICSILLRNKPDEAKFMILSCNNHRFSIYNKVPHTLFPVITDPNGVLPALSEIKKIIMERYTLFSKAGVRNIEKYNRKSELEKLPYIVLIINEVEDIYTKDVAEFQNIISSITQLGRSAGIHVVLSTKRTKIYAFMMNIKTYMSSKIAFQTIDEDTSKFILDESGAEKLSGQGQMLYLPLARKEAKQVHSAYIYPEEIERIIEYVSKQPTHSLDMSMNNQWKQNMEHIYEEIQNENNTNYEYFVQGMVAYCMLENWQMYQAKVGNRYKYSIIEIEDKLEKIIRNTLENKNSSYHDFLNKIANENGQLAIRWVLDCFESKRKDRLKDKEALLRIARNEIGFSLSKLELILQQENYETLTVNQFEKLFK